MYGNTVKSAILKRMSRRKDNSFLRSEFSDLGSQAQITRALGVLLTDGKLVRIGYGIYARARKSTLSGKPVPAENMVSLAFESLRKLGYNPQLSQAAKDYAEGKTTQIPARPKVNVGNARITRKIQFGNSKVTYEKNNGTRIKSNKGLGY